MYVHLRMRLEPKLNRNSLRFESSNIRCGDKHYQRCGAKPRTTQAACGPTTNVLGHEIHDFQSSSGSDFIPRCTCPNPCLERLVPSVIVATIRLRVPALPLARPAGRSQRYRADGETLHGGKATASLCGRNRKRASKNQNLKIHQ